jgi:hypothetical protein
LDHDALDLRILHKYRQIKDGKTFLVNAYKGKKKISLVSSNQAKRLVNASKQPIMIVMKPQGSQALEVVFPNSSFRMECNCSPPT